MLAVGVASELAIVIEGLERPVLVTDDQRRYVQANQAACELLDLNREEIFNRRIDDFAANADPAAVDQQWNRFLSCGFQQGRFSLKRPNGGIRSVEFTAVASIRPGLHISFLRDVTGQEEAEAALRESEATLRLSEARFRNLMEQSPFSTQVFALDGRPISVNRAWEELWGADMRNLENYNILEDRQLENWGVMPMIRLAFEGERQQLPDVCYQPPSGIFQGQEIWVSAFLYPVKDESGTVREVVLIHENITDRKKREGERAAQSEELARSNAELQRFAYAASHDLREPLRNITIFSQLLERSAKNKLGPEELEHVDQITNSARRMSALIDGLLEYSRLSFRRDLVLEEANAGDLLNEALDNLQTAIALKQAEVKVGDMPVIRCMPLYIIQLWQNLIGNAIKYTRRRPCIEIWSETSDGEWKFSVKDNGIGIDRRFQGQIFDLFRRLDSAEFPGTGLGLAICKAIVESHTGRIGVESEEGRGSTFWFTLPK
jgi:PAS domain S-box-containing protein